MKPTAAAPTKATTNNHHFKQIMLSTAASRDALLLLLYVPISLPKCFPGRVLHGPPGRRVDAQDVAHPGPIDVLAVQEGGPPPLLAGSQVNIVALAQHPGDDCINVTASRGPKEA